MPSPPRSGERLISRSLAQVHVSNEPIRPRTFLGQILARSFVQKGRVYFTATKTHDFPDMPYNCLTSQAIYDPDSIPFNAHLMLFGWPHEQIAVIVSSIVHPEATIGHDQFADEQGRQSRGYGLRRWSRAGFWNGVKPIGSLEH